MSAHEASPGPSLPDEFRWQAFFQRATDALFLLNRQRRVLFVNRAWETLTGLSSTQARTLYCRRQQPATLDDSLEEILAHVLCPPSEVLQGHLGRARRLLPAQATTPTAPRRWGDVEFLPLRDRKGVRAVFGRITPAAVVETAAAVPLPETVVDLREGSACRYAFEHLPTTLPAMRRVAEQVRLASQVQVPVLLVGEAGVGKHWLARLIHYQGPTRERSFAALDCSRLPVEALLDILVGECGDNQRAQLATVYLKEPAQLPREVQARLAELIGHRRGPRVLAGCRTSPAEEVRAGRLLEELHAALGLLVIDVPPLRERRGELPFLVERLLGRVPNKEAAPTLQMAPEVWDALQRYDWPGNLRELADVLRQTCRQATGAVLAAADLPAALRLPHELPVGQAEGGWPLDTILEHVERRMLELALRRTGGNKTRAADLLAVPRPRLFRRLKALGLVTPDDPIEIEEAE